MSEGGLSQDATTVLSLAREMNVLDLTGLKTLQALFTHRINDDLVKTLVLGKEKSLSISLYRVLKNSRAENTRGYVLRFLADLCQLCPPLCAEFAVPNAIEVFGDDPIAEFAATLDNHRESLGIFNPAIFLLAATLARTQEGDKARAPLLQKFVAVCTSSLGAAELVVHKIEFVVHAVCAFLRRSEFRAIFLEAGLIPRLPRLLGQAVAADTAALVQLTYELLLSCRLLSFDYACLVELHKHKVIPMCHRVLQRATKEKCIRMALYVLRNFANAQLLYWRAERDKEPVNMDVCILGRINPSRGGPNFFADMIGIGVLKTVKQLQRKKYGDEDITAELETLREVLENNLQDLTTWSEYKGELDSGVLEWSPAHTSVRFWKENIKNIDANRYEVLDQLSNLVLTTQNETTLAIAVHDIGEIVKNHPSGAMLLTMPMCSGVKERMMNLMASNNPEVAKNALAAVQKVLILRSS